MTTNLQQKMMKYLSLAIDLAALACAFLTMFNCKHYMDVTFTLERREPYFETSAIGLWRKEYAYFLGSDDPEHAHVSTRGDCVSWTTDDQGGSDGRDNFDGAWKFARAMALLSLPLGILLLLYGCVGQSLKLRYVAFRNFVAIYAGFHFFVAVISMLVLVSKASNMPGDVFRVYTSGYCPRGQCIHEFEVDDTELGSLFYLPVVASVLWFISGFLVLVFFKDMENEEASPATTTTTTPDGATPDSEQAPTPQKK